VDRERAETYLRLLAEAGTTWIEIAAAGRSAQVRATLPLA
jgi:hypothetical protein